MPDQRQVSHVPVPADRGRSLGQREDGPQCPGKPFGVAVEPFVQRGGAVEIVDRRSVGKCAWTWLSSRGVTGAGLLLEVGEQAAQAAGDGGVAFCFAGPAALVGVLSELLLDVQPGLQPRGVFGGGDELSAGQVEVALAGTFGGQAQAVAGL